MAGLIGTALAGALAGGGSAMKENAMSQIKQRHEEAMTKLDHDLAMERQDDSQQFQTDERVAGQEYQTGRDETLQGYEQENANLAHDLKMQQERYRQGQQNARSAAGRQANDWQLVPNDDGGYTQYSPSRNESRPANLPEGVNMGGMNGDLSDVEKRRLDDIDAQTERIMTGPGDVTKDITELSKEQKLKLAQLNKTKQSLLGAGGGPSLLETMLQGDYDPGDNGGGNRGGDDGGGDGGGGEQPPQSARDRFNERQRKEKEAQAEQAAHDEVNRLADAAIASVSRKPTSMFPTGTNYLAPGEREEAQRQYLRQVMTALDAEDNKARRAILLKAMDRLQDAGVSLK